MVVWLRKAFLVAVMSLALLAGLFGGTGRIGSTSTMHLASITYAAPAMPCPAPPKVC